MIHLNRQSTIHGSTTYSVHMSELSTTGSSEATSFSFFSSAKCSNQTYSNEHDSNQAAVYDPRIKYLLFNEATYQFFAIHLFLWLSVFECSESCVFEFALLPYVSPSLPFHRLHHRSVFVAAQASHQIWSLTFLHDVSNTRSTTHQQPLDASEKGCAGCTHRLEQQYAGSFWR